MDAPGFICLPIEGYSAHFKLEVIMNKTAINIHLQVFVLTSFSFFFGKYLRVGLLGLTASVCLPL